MLKFKFSKLVRDKIVDHQIASGAKPSFRQLTIEEHKKELVNKISEEADEITQADPEDIAAEIADVQIGLVRADVSFSEPHVVLEEFALLQVLVAFPSSQLEFLRFATIKFGCPFCLK